MTRVDGATPPRRRCMSHLCGEDRTITDSKTASFKAHPTHDRFEFWRVLQEASEIIALTGVQHACSHCLLDDSDLLSHQFSISIRQEDEHLDIRATVGHAQLLNDVWEDGPPSRSQRLSSRSKPSCIQAYPFIVQAKSFSTDSSEIPSSLAMRSRLARSSSSTLPSTACHHHSVSQCQLTAFWSDVLEQFWEWDRVRLQ